MLCKATSSLKQLNDSVTVLEAAQLSRPVQSEDVVFYTHMLCPFAERVWLCLLHHEVKHNLVSTQQLLPLR